jgi:hypothetical protein
MRYDNVLPEHGHYIALCSALKWIMEQQWNDDEQGKTREPKIFIHHEFHVKLLGNEPKALQREASL